MTVFVLIFSLEQPDLMWSGRVNDPNSIAHAVTTVAQGHRLIGPATAGKIQRRLSHWPQTLAECGFSALVAFA